MTLCTFGLQKEMRASYFNKGNEEVEGSEKEDVKSEDCEEESVTTFCALGQRTPSSPDTARFKLLLPQMPDVIR